MVAKHHSAASSECTTYPLPEILSLGFPRQEPAAIAATAGAAFTIRAPLRSARTVLVERSFQSWAEL